MDGKITLITPPDIFENDSTSILFLHLSDDDQTAISKWLSKNDIKQNLNLYVYTNETDTDWLFYALGRCEYKYIDINSLDFVTKSLCGYILSKNNVYYKTTDEELVDIYKHINLNRIDQIETFLESILIGN
jgi:hypothetical protein